MIPETPPTELAYREFQSRIRAACSTRGWIMDITRNTRVGDIATLVPVSIAVFERHGVDVGTKGDLPLEEALRETGLSVGDILLEIERELQAAEEEDRLHEHLASAAPESLVDHIREVHHHLHAQLPCVGEQMVPALLVFGDTCDDLFDIARQFDRLRAMLLAHLAEEERDVLSLVARLSADTGDEATVDRVAAAAVLTRASEEHQAALDAVRTMRDLIDRCAPVEDVVSQESGPPECPELFQELRTLETAVHRHVHLEDDVLFPAIRRLAGI
jgi:regulator of cell morphogenesis and NO signaling